MVDVLKAANVIKHLARQINVVIHTLGILLCLPHILRAGEVIHYVALGAGNTGRSLDLETNVRVAEFKFTHWQGRPESIQYASPYVPELVALAAETRERSVRDYRC
jgi:hypothetical protein